MDLLPELERTRSETLAFFRLGGGALERRYGPTKWNVRDLLHHLSDSETVLFDRIRRVLSEPSQVMWSVDQDAWAKHLGYASRPLELSRNLYEASRDGILYYARLHYEASGGLVFVHSETGRRTLKDEFEKVALHNEHHLGHIRRALSAAG